MPDSADSGRHTRARWYWTAPYVAVGVFALTMLGLVWLLQARDAETQRNAVARDVQWAEQTMRLHMQGTEEFLTQLARDMAGDALDMDGFQVRANQHIANNGELIKDRKSTRLNSSHIQKSRMPSSA